MGSVVTPHRVGVTESALTLCFLIDPSTKRPPLIDTSSLRVTHPSKVTARTTSRPNTGTLSLFLAVSGVFWA